MQQWAKHALGRGEVVSWNHVYYVGKKKVLRNKVALSFSLHCTGETIFIPSVIPITELLKEIDCSFLQTFKISFKVFCLCLNKRHNLINKNNGCVMCTCFQFIFLL